MRAQERVRLRVRLGGCHQFCPGREEGAFPYGTVGAYLKQAISISRSQRSGSVGADRSHGGDQDASYQIQRVGKSGAG